jgi:hypothetical protein
MTTIKRLSLKIFNYLLQIAICQPQTARGILPSAFCQLLIAICILSTVLSCKQPKVEFQPNDCKQLPAFLTKIGFDPSRSAFTTSEKRQKGIALIQIK